MKEIKTQVYNQFIEEKTQGIKSNETISNRAERIVLEKYSNGTYPKVYPWEKKAISNLIYLKRLLYLFGSYFLVIIIAYFLGFLYNIQ